MILVTLGLAVVVAGAAWFMALLAGVQVQEGAAHARAVVVLSVVLHALAGAAWVQFGLTVAGA